MASRAIPSHLKPPGAGNGEAAEFARKHHGKSQSHVVSEAAFILCLPASTTEREGGDPGHMITVTGRGKAYLSFYTFGIKSKKHRAQSPNFKGVFIALRITKLSRMLNESHLTQIKLLNDSFTSSSIPPHL
ncbi:hypothetical protein FKW77_008239 [Venturia effusa]|uniref:Uncharacterized protein n=1 Tax=Venturia effusa TaxID=50376 RepID=A0A517L3V1_9PEZI|nr:hypothetical protein FKW77_008239 [Venturia effusa]